MEKTGRTQEEIKETMGDFKRFIIDEGCNIPDRSIAKDVREWVETTDGEFSLEDCYRLLQLVKKNEKRACSQEMHRLVKAGIIEHSMVGPGLCAIKNEVT